MYMVRRKLDRRVKYTIMVLKNSLVELLHEKPLEKITVKEICDISDINRGTFYSHFKDQYALYSSLVDELLDNLFSRLGDFMSSDEEEIHAQVLSEFEYIRDNADIFRTLINSGVANSTKEKIRDVIKDMYLSKVSESADIDYVNASYSFFAAGAVDLISYWLNSGMTKTPEEMAAFSLKLTADGLSSLL